MDDHRPNTPVVPHGPGQELVRHGPGRSLAGHGKGGPLDPHGPGGGIATGDHDDSGILVPAGISLLATDPPPGEALLSTEYGEVFLVESP